MTFSNKLSELRKRAGLSQEQLAEMLDVSRQSVSKWEGQQTLPETAKVVAIADIFHVSLDVLLRDEYELDEVPSTHFTPQTAVTGADTSEEPAPSETQSGGNIRAKKWLAAVLGGVAILLVAGLVIGMLGAKPGQSPVPPASVSSSEQTGRGAAQEQVKQHMKFKHYVRGVMKYIKVQNGKSKEDTDYAQAP